MRKLFSLAGLCALCCLWSAAVFSQSLRPSNDAPTRRGGPADYYVPQGVDCSGISDQKLVYERPLATSSKPFQALLDRLAGEMRYNPACRVVIKGNGGGSKVEQAASWMRVYNIIEYLTDKLGIDRPRFLFEYGAPGNASEVLIRAAAEGETGVSSPPNPHPAVRLE